MASRTQRAAQNRSQHAKLKAQQDHVLLRLGKGDRGALDVAASAAGVSRAAFAQLYLVPFAAAMDSARLGKLAALGEAQRIGLTSVLARLIDQASSPQAISGGDREAIASEFDALFGPEP